MRLKEHQWEVFVRYKNTSALSEHVLDTGHTFDWGNASVLDVCQQLQQRLYLESWHVYRQTTSLNRERASLSPYIRP